MGHLVNPISFRLGRTNTWRSQWYTKSNTYFTNLKIDFLIYNYIESFFKFTKLLKRSSSVSSFILSTKKYKPNSLNLKSIHARNTKFKHRLNLFNYLNSKNSFKRRSRLVDLNLKKSKLKLKLLNKHLIKVERYKDNQFIKKLSLIFSHLTLSKVKNSLILNLFLYDGALQNRISTIKNIQTEKEKYKNKNKFNFKFRNKFRVVRIRKLNKFNFVNINTSINITKYKKNSYTKFRKNINVSKINFKNDFMSKVGFQNKNKMFNLATPSTYFYKSNLNLNLSLSSDLNNERKRKFIFSNYYYYLNCLKIPFTYNKVNFIISKVNIINKLKLLKVLIYLLYSKFRTSLQFVYLVRTCLFLTAQLRLMLYLTSLKFVFKLNKYSNSYNNNNNNSLKFKFKHKNKNSKVSINKKNKILFTTCTILNKITKLELFLKILFKKLSFNSSKLVYIRRFKIFYYLSRILHINLSLLLNRNSLLLPFNIINLNWLGIGNKSVTSYMIANYITTKLLQKYTIFEVLKPITKDLALNNTIAGFKIACSGRLTKKLRAGLFVQRGKSVPLSTLDMNIDYSVSTVRLRHGICGIKIWINRKSSFIPFEYKLNYSYNLI